MALTKSTELSLPFPSPATFKSPSLPLRPYFITRHIIITSTTGNSNPRERTNERTMNLRKPDLKIDSSSVVRNSGKKKHKAIINVGERGGETFWGQRTTLIAAMRGRSAVYAGRKCVACPLFAISKLDDDDQVQAVAPAHIAHWIGHGSVVGLIAFSLSHALGPRSGAPGHPSAVPIRWRCCTVP